jgi:dienelactone hydrolase
MAIIVFLLGLLSWPAYAETVKIKWNAGTYSQPWDTGNSGYIDGWTKNFINGTVEERGRIALDGFLDAEIVKPQNTKGPISFVVLLHGCSGMNDLLQKWGHGMAARLIPLGYGVLILDSFKSRDVSDICSDPSQLGWARRRADDAYSALDYLIDKGLAIPNKVYVIGRSNGATTTLIIMNQVLGDLHQHKFAGGFPMQPSCLYMKNVEFYAPVRQFLAEKDQACNPMLCIAMAASPRKVPVQTMVFKGAHHGYEDKIASQQFNGYRLAYNAEAAEGTIKGIIAALKADEHEKN